MKLFGICTALVVFLATLDLAVANGNNERRINPLNENPLHRYLSLACVNGNVEFRVQWNLKIGETGTYKRHLFLPGDLSDTHILLRVLPDQSSTGVIDSDATAKALIKVVLDSVNRGSIYVEVFPEGRDPVSGRWEQSVYSYSEFREITDWVSKECDWDRQKPIEATVPTVRPGAPFKER